MHVRFLATFNKENAATSPAARDCVQRYLNQEGFAGDNTRWSYGLADWFVVGGRWSGELSRYSWAKQLTAKMEAIENEKGVQVWGAFYGSDAEKKKIQAELTQQFQNMWDKEAPEAYRGIPSSETPTRKTGMKMTPRCSHKNSMTDC